MVDILVNKIPLPLSRPHDIPDIAVDTRIYNPISSMHDIWSGSMDSHPLVTEGQLVGTNWLLHPFTLLNTQLKLLKEKTLNVYDYLTTQFSTYAPYAGTNGEDAVVSAVGIFLMTVVVVLVILGLEKLWKM